MKDFFINNIKWAGFFAGITLLLFAPYFFAEGSLFASDQIGYRGWSHYFDALKNFEIPLWNQYKYGGVPTFDAMYGDGNYPIFILVGLLVPIDAMVATNFILHVFIAGLCAYILVRKYFGLNRFLSLSMACAYMLNTNFVSHIYPGHTGKFYIIAWLPLGLYFLLKSTENNSRWYHLLGLSFTLLMYLLTSHLQFTYMILMGYFVVWFYRFYRLARAKLYKKAALNLGKFWVPVLLGVGMGYFILFPPLEYNNNHSVRGGELRTTYEHSTSWSLHPEELFSMITVAEFNGINKEYWGRNYFKLNSEYPGMVILYIGVLGFVLFRSRWFGFWLVMCILAAIYALGDHTFFFRLFYNFIPGVKSFRAPGMILVWFAMALTMMAATSLHYFSRKEFQESLQPALTRKILKISLGIAGGFLILGIFPSLIYSIWNSIFSAEAFPNFKNQAAAMGSFQIGAIRNAVIIAATSFTLYKWAFNSFNPKNLGLALTVIICVDLLPVNYNFIQNYDLSMHYPDDPVIGALKKEQEKEDFRLFGMQGAYDAGLTQHNRIEITDGYADNEYNLYRDFRGEPPLQSPNLMKGLVDHRNGTVSGSKFLDMLNVKYLAFKTKSRAGIQLALNKTYMPREYMAYTWEYQENKSIIPRMMEQSFNPRSHLILDAAAEKKLVPTSTDTTLTYKSLKIIKSEKLNNSINYELEIPDDGIFVTNDVYFPNWNLRVNDKPAELLRVNYLFRGVYLKKGRHKLRYEYRSPWLKKGLLVSFLSLAALLTIVFGYRFFEKKLLEV